MHVPPFASLSTFSSVPASEAFLPDDKSEWKRYADRVNAEDLPANLRLEKKKRRSEPINDTFFLSMAKRHCFYTAVGEPKKCIHHRCEETRRKTDSCEAQCCCLLYSSVSVARAEEYRSAILKCKALCESNSEFCTASADFTTCESFPIIATNEQWSRAIFSMK